MIEVFTFSLICSPQQFEAAHEILDGAERERAERFVMFDHRRRFVIRRAMRRVLFAKYLQARPSALRYDEQEFGQPIIADAPKDFHFSTSHSHDVAVIALSRSNVGIDIEYLSRVLDYIRFAKRVFSSDEVQIISAREGEARKRAFFNCWTGKEAYLKALGLGLKGGLGSFAVRCAPEEPPGLVWSKRDQQPAQPWFFERFCSSHCVMTLVTDKAENEGSTKLASLDVKSVSAGQPIVASNDRPWQEC